MRNSKPNRALRGALAKLSYAAKPLAPPEYSRMFSSKQSDQKQTTF
jgi:hypothetical protein